jgi:glycerophosphoryl diester phosphodiesterase
VIALGGVAVLWAFGNLFVTAFCVAAFALGVLDLFRAYGPRVDSTNLGNDAPGARRLRVTPAGFVVGVGIAAVLAFGAGAWLLHGIRTEDAVVVIAHRGASGKAPENTLAAVRQAIEDGADFVEIDVQETADGKVVVMHDSDFMKLSGEPLKIWDATFEQVRSLDVGSWFAPEFASERVPTLREVLLVARGRVRVVIELKYYGHDEQLEQRVVDIVEATDMTDQVQLMSLKYPAVQKLHALRPDWTVGLLAATAIGDLVRLDADFLAVKATIAKRSLIRSARAAGKPLYVWTLNDPVSMSRMVSRGVDGIITDEPAIAREVLVARADMSSIERLLLQAAILFDRPLENQAGRNES